MFSLITNYQDAGSFEALFSFNHQFRGMSQILGQNGLHATQCVPISAGLLPGYFGNIGPGSERKVIL